MAGHSKWANIKHRKSAVDAKKGKIFGRIIREITVAAKLGGPDPEANPRLRAAIAAARAQNMPNKNIENAIAKGCGKSDGGNLEEIVFEGYGPGGVALVIETMTDNRNRTVSEVRHAITKAGGKLGTENSVRWMFKDKGIITVGKDQKSEEELMEFVLEAGAEDMTDEGDYYEIVTSPETFNDVVAALENAGIKTSSASIEKIPENTVKVEGEMAQKILKLLSALDDLDDTQKVYGNFDISDEDMEKFVG